MTGFGRGVFRSDDGGESWSLKNKGLPEKEPFAWRLAKAGDGALYLVIARRWGQRCEKNPWGSKGFEWMTDSPPPSESMQRVFAQWLAAECAKGPLLLVLEDLQWGDLPSVKLVDAALRDLRDSAFMVLAFARRHRTI